MLLTAEQSAQQRQKTIVDKDDIQSALAQARAIKTLTKINALTKRIKRQSGKTIDF